MHPYYLVVDSGEEDEPRPRHFGTRESAVKALNELDPHYKKFAWLHFRAEGQRNQVLVKDGVWLSPHGD